MITYIVKPGDSLFKISNEYSVSIPELRKANPNIKNPQRLIVGQEINIPIPAGKLGTIDVNGYAFPNINMEVLKDTLPYLTYLSIFSYQVRPDGSLSTINDAPLIAAARAANVAPIMVITNIEEGASFNSDIANTVLTDELIQDNLIYNVIKTLEEKYYYGVDIDFEYVLPQDRENYNNFLRKFVRRLRSLGYTIATALAPKLRADQAGLLYEAHDYPVHGVLVDHVILMTYEWGYTYGPAQAVAPIDQVKKVLDYAVTVIPSDKILMGMPNYGYDWTLPFVRGSAARSLSNTQAAELAQKYNARIQYDPISQAPFFNYTDEQKRQHVVWFDNARSIAARLRLVNKYKLGGVSYWTINKFNPINWTVLDSMYNINKVLT